MSNIVAQISEIDGSATDAGFVDRIKCTAIRHAMSLAVSNRTSTRTASVATHGSIELTHALDKASPKLKLKAAQGTNLGTVTIDRLKTVRGTPTSVERWTLENAYLTKVELDTPVEHTTNEAGEPTEKFHLAYSGIQWSYLEGAENISGTYNITAGSTTATA